MARINVRELQTPIRERYKNDPQAAQIRLKVRSTQADLTDPLHCAAQPLSTPDINWRSGAHPAVGGTGDVPCSGDLLIGALGACQDTWRPSGGATSSFSGRQVWSWGMKTALIPACSAGLMSERGELPIIQVRVGSSFRSSTMAR